MVFDKEQRYTCTFAFSTLMYLTQIVGFIFCGMIGKSNIPFHSLWDFFPLSYRQATVKLIFGLGVAVRPLRTGNNLHLRLLDLTSCHLSLCSLAL